MNAIAEVASVAHEGPAHGYASRLRHASYDLVVLSPHFDDAAYSLAGTLLRAREEGKRAVVVTVFGHGRTHAPSGHGTYDDYATREREDREAMGALDVDFVWLNQPEWTFRRSRGRDLLAELVPYRSFARTRVLESVTRALAPVVDALLAEGGSVFAPLGVGAHPDHRIVHEVTRARSDWTVLYYEDVPYAHEDALVESRLATLCALPGPGATRLARAMLAIAARGVSRALFVAPLAFVLSLAELARPLGRCARNRIDPIRLRAFERDVDRVVAEKAHAVALYRSQTKLFFDSSRAIEAQFARRNGIVVERCWRIAP